MTDEPTPPQATPKATVDISASLVERLIASQLPQWADAPLTFASEGWDNVMYRLGDDLAVRLPRRELAATIVATEHRWLPALATNWSFDAPVPVAVGQPQGEYPWNWSVVPWLAGDVAMDAPLAADGAADLGRALAQVHTPAPPDAPHNPWRSVPLPERAERFAQRVPMLVASENAQWKLDEDKAHALFESADARGGLTWCHLDLHGRNILTRTEPGNAGRLAGILDWGDAAAGDPCTDLGQALYLVGAENFEALAAAYSAAGGIGEPYAPRVRAEALHYAVTMASLEDDAYADTGWLALADLGIAKLRT